MDTSTQVTDSSGARRLLHPIGSAGRWGADCRRDTGGRSVGGESWCGCTGSTPTRCSASGTVALTRAQLSILEGIDRRRPERNWDPQLSVERTRCFCTRSCARRRWQRQGSCDTVHMFAATLPDLNRLHPPSCGACSLEASRRSWRKRSSNWSCGWKRCNRAPPRTQVRPRISLLPKPLPS